MTSISRGMNHRSGNNRRMVGVGGVIVFHALLIYALVTGLAQDVIKVVQKKVEVAVINEPPPPPPPPPPPKIEKVIPQAAPPQPQAYVPPVVNPPPQVQSQSAIQATTTNPAPQPTPTPAPVEAPKGPISAKANCSAGDNPEYPSKAQEDEIQGTVHVVFQVGGNGKFTGITNISYDGSIPPRYRSGFQSAITTALRSYSCKADALLSREFAFKLDSGA